MRTWSSRTARSTRWTPLAAGPGAVAVKDGRIALVGTDDDVRAAVGPGTEVIDLRGRMLLPGFQDAHVHPVLGGLDLLQCALHEAGSLPEYERIIDGVRAGAPRCPVDPRRRLVDGRVPPRPSDEGRARPPRARPARVPPQPGRPRRVGEHARPRARRHHARHARPRRRTDRTRRRRRPLRDAARGRDEPRGRPRAAAHGRGVYAGLAMGQQYMHALGITAWQDAIVEATGNANNFDPYLRAASRGELTAPGGRGAVVGPSPGARADRRPRRPAGARQRRPVRRDQRQDHAGRGVRELHRGGPRALPRRARPSHRQPRDLVRRSRAAEGGRHAAGRARLPGALPLAGRAGGAGGPRRDRGRPCRERSRTTSAITSPTSRSCTPTTSRGSGSSAWSRTHNRCGRRTRARWTSSRSRSSGTRGPRGSTRSRASRGRAPSSRWAATGACPPPTPCRRCTWP